MEGQLVVCDCSTESKNWYKVVQVGKIVEQKPDGRRLLYRDNPKKKDLDFACSIGEWVFKVEGTHILGGKEVPKAQRMWRLAALSEDKPKPTYKDILLEHYPNFDKERFDEFAQNFCFAEFFDDDSSNCEYGCINCLENCWESECKYKWGLTPEGEADIEEYLKDTQPPAHAEKSDTEAADLPNPPVPANAEEIASTFNYAVLSAEMGDYLKHKEQQLKNEYMNFTANCGAIFAEVQEKLAKDGHGTFRKWIESMGFKKDTVYRMIDVHKFRLSLIATDENKTQEIFDSLPKYLQYDISAKSAPPELVEQVLSGDITTHTEYIKLKKDLDEANKRAENAESQARTYQHNYFQMEKNFSEACSENTNLEKRIKELKNKPIEVQSIPEEEIERRAAEMSKKLVRSKEIEFDDRLRELQSENRKLQKELSHREITLDDCFENSDSVSEKDISEFYEMLHDKAKYALKDCVCFIARENISKPLKEKLTDKFHNFGDLLEMYYEDLEV